MDYVEERGGERESEKILNEGKGKSRREKKGMGRRRNGEENSIWGLREKKGERKKNGRR